MQHQQKNVLAPPKRKHMPTQRKLAIKRKRRSRRSRQRSTKLPFAHRTDRKPNSPRARRQNNLPRHPVALRKHRAQALVPLNDVAKRSFQRRYIKLPAKPHRQRDRVVRSTPLKTIQKPQPTLSIRQRNFRRSLNRTQPRSRRSPLAQPNRQTRNRRRLKQAADR
jgi:hypothetical protein